MYGNKYNFDLNAFVCILWFLPILIYQYTVRNKPIVPLIVIKGNIHNFHLTNSPYYKAYKHF